MEIVSKMCRRCDAEKPLADFGADSSKKDGRRSACRSCYNPGAAANARKRAPEKAAYFAEYRATNRDRIKQTEARRRFNRRHLCLVATVRTRARKRKLDFDLDDHLEAIRDRLVAGVCELTGLPFDMSPGRTFASPSIDRINPKKGYVLSNIRLVYLGINAALGDWGEDVLEHFIRPWLDRRAADAL